MASGSSNISNIVGLGGVDTSSNLTIPEANSQGYFSLVVGRNVTVSGHYSPFYKNGILYQVTSGKTCVVVHIIWTAGDLGAAQLVHSLTTFAIDASTITAGAYQGGASANYTIAPVTASVPVSYATMYAFPSVSFPGIQTSSGSGSMILICKEI